MKIVVKGKPTNEKAYRFLSRVGKRLPQFVRGLVEGVAEDFLGDVQMLAPWDEIEDYPEMLELYSVPSDDGVIVGVFPPPRMFSQNLKEKDAGHTLLWIKPVVRRGEAVSPGAVVLARYNPWTMTALPWVPGKREAQIVSMRVRAFEAERVAQDRRKDLGVVAEELGLYGIKVRPGEEVELGRRVTRDVMFEVARIEFGYDRQGEAHWRPAVMNVPKSVRKRGSALFDWLVSDSAVYNSGVETKPGNRSSLKFVQKFQNMIRG